jgi:hypothetical protein
MRAVPAMMVVLAGMSTACKKGGDESAGWEAQVNLSKMVSLIGLAADRAGGFAEAPACAGDPPVNEFSVPRVPSEVAGRQYKSDPLRDWAGPWSTFRFALSKPIRVLYCYESDGRSFTIHGSTDVDGDGIWAHYQRSGELANGQTVVGPLVAERDGE